MAPEVSFVHNFPGPVNSGIARDMTGVIGFLVRFLGPLFMYFVAIPPEESGAYHLYFATNGAYCPKIMDQADSGIVTSTTLNSAKARGLDGVIGSGMYSIDERGESARVEIEAELAQFRNDGTKDKIWEDLQQQWRRITGS